MAKQNFSVARIETRTRATVGKFERHIERKNDSYENMNVDLSRTPMNVSFKSCGELTYNEHLDLNAVMAQRQAGKKTVLLLEVQPLQGAVVFLDDTRYREQVIVQLPTGRSHVHHKEGQQEHSLVPALQIFQEGLCVVAVRHKVGREYV